jgi:hypothetical protein
MQITGQNLINQALLELGVTQPGQTPTTDESNDGLAKLQQLIDAWSAQGTTVYETAVTNIPLTGVTFYGIGSGSTRPVRLEGAWLTMSNNVGVPVEVLGAAEFARVPNRSVNDNWVKACYYEAGFPGRVWVAPIATSGTLSVVGWQPLATVATLGATLDLPYGYIRALVLNLMLDLAAQYGKPITDGMVALAASAKDALGEINKTNRNGEAPAGAPQQ